MPTHMPVLVDFWAVGSGSSSGAMDASQVWMALTGFYGIDPAMTSFTVSSKYSDGGLCNLTFTCYASEKRITQQIAPSVL